MYSFETANDALKHWTSPSSLYIRTSRQQIKTPTKTTPTFSPMSFNHVTLTSKALKNCNKLPPTHARSSPVLERHCSSSGCVQTDHAVDVTMVGETGKRGNLPIGGGNCTISGIHRLTGIDIPIVGI